VFYSCSAFTVESDCLHEAGLLNSILAKKYAEVSACGLNSSRYLHGIDAMKIQFEVAF
jgi:hypothetical protein